MNLNNNETGNFQNEQPILDIKYQKLSEIYRNNNVYSS